MEFTKNIPSFSGTSSTVVPTMVYNPTNVFYEDENKTVISFPEQPNQEIFRTPPRTPPPIVSEVPEYAVYSPFPTLPLDQVPFLEGQIPINPEVANQYEWEPVTQKFVNKSNSTFIAKDAFLATFFPDLAREKFECHQVEVESAVLGPGIKIERSEGSNLVTLKVWLTDNSGGVIDVREVQIPQDATKEEIIEQVGQVLNLPANRVRLKVYHPRMVDSLKDPPSEGVQHQDLYGDETIGDVITSFPQLEGDPFEYVITVVATPMRRGAERVASRPLRLSQAQISPLSGSVISARGEEVPVQLLIDALNKPRESRTPFEQGLVLAELNKRARARKERIRMESLYAPLEAEEVGLRFKPLKIGKRARVEESLEARQVQDQIREVLNLLYDGLVGNKVISASVMDDLMNWLVSGILSGEQIEGVNYADQFATVHRSILDNIQRKPQGERDLSSWLFLLSKIDELVDQARQVSARDPRERDRIPIFDSETGEVVDYQVIEDEDLNDTTAFAQKRLHSFTPEHETEHVHAPQVQCHSCGKWRLLDPNTRLINYRITTKKGGNEQCVEFGFNFAYKDFETQLKIPMNSEYIVASSYDVNTLPEEFVSNASRTARFFGLTALHEGNVLEVEPVGTDLTPIDFDAASTQLFEIPAIGAISSEGDVYVVKKGDGTYFKIDEGYATNFYCITEDGREITIPLSDIHTYVENHWECGDFGMKATSSPIDATLRLIRDNERLLADRILTPENERIVKDRINRLKESLHQEKELSGEQIKEALVGMVYETNSQYEEMLDTADAIAERQLEKVKDYFEFEPESDEEISNEDLKAEEIRELVRRGERPGEEDIEFIGTQTQEEVNSLSRSIASLTAELQEVTRIYEQDIRGLQGRERVARTREFQRTQKELTDEINYLQGQIQFLEPLAKGKPETLAETIARELRKYPTGISYTALANSILQSQRKTEFIPDEELSSFAKQVYTMLTKKKKRYVPYIGVELPILPNNGKRFILKEYLTEDNINNIIDTIQGEAMLTNQTRPITPENITKSILALHAAVTQKEREEEEQLTALSERTARELQAEEERAVKKRKVSRKPSRPAETLIPSSGKMEVETLFSPPLSPTQVQRRYGYSRYY